MADNNYDEIADYLVNGYWTDPNYEPLVDFGELGFDQQERSPHRWPSSEISVDISDLDESDQALARLAFDLWSDVCGLYFNFETATPGSPSDITISPHPTETAGDVTRSGSTILSGSINIEPSPEGSADDPVADLARLGTLVHEIGHVLGLGHSGPYNGSRSWGPRQFDNDSKHVTIMSYTPADSATVTPQIADILAVQSIYGANTTTRGGDTVYGVGNTTGNFLYGIFPEYIFPTLTIYDTGGFDTLNYSGTSLDQVIDLNAEAFSSIYGVRDNIAIARDTIIEKAVSGGGDDDLIGNDYANVLEGGAGNDELIGNGGEDHLFGQAGNDRLKLGTAGLSNGEIYDGGAGLDTLDFTDHAGSYRVDLISTTMDAILEGPALVTADDLSGWSPIGAGAIGGSGAPALGPGVPVTGIVTARVLNIEFVRAGDGNDVLIGDAQGNQLNGGGGNDLLVGHAGVDDLIGGAGNDVLSPGLAPFETGERYIGSEGIDRLDLTAFGSDILVDLLTHDLDFIRTPLGDPAFVTAIENVDSGRGNDRLFGDREDNVLHGNDGNDVVLGDDGDDRLFGDYGDDILNGGADDDLLVGGLGNDSFEFDASFGHDTVQGFEGGTGAGDVLRFEGSAFASVAAIMAAASQVGDDVVIAVDSANTVTLENRQLSDLAPDDFAFL
ncbi:MAG: M10 family metallopeptidase C-terminal domain-containing protein [Rhodobiaceae bacterium]|nr:M10 family metallopeptidase C-terminal domain-containing protein [Rhodobiaceae bacterium]